MHEVLMQTIRPRSWDKRKMGAWCMFPRNWRIQSWKAWFCISIRKKRHFKTSVCSLIWFFIPQRIPMTGKNYAKCKGYQNIFLKKIKHCHCAQFTYTGDIQNICAIICCNCYNISRRCSKTGLNKLFKDKVFPKITD